MKENNMSIKKLIPVILIILLGGYLALSILKTEKVTVNSEHGEEAKAETVVAEIPKGPHKGKLFTKDGFSLEITIYETGVPPEFRVFILDNGKTVNLDEVKLTVELKRLQRTDLIKFKKHEDYLLGDQEIVEPHSFDVTINASYKGKNYKWSYPSYEGRTTLTPEAIKKAKVVIEKIMPIAMENKVQLPGEIVINTDRVSHIVPQLAGIVSSVGKNMGDYVAKGDLLAVVNSRELADSKREYLEAIHHHELVKTTFARENELWKKKLTSEEEYLKSKHAVEEAVININASKQKLKALNITNSEISSLIVNPEQNLARYEIRAPYGGIVNEKHISVGEAVREDKEIYVIADMSTVWANITVYSKDINAVKPGQSITIRSEALDAVATGKIIFIGSMVGESTRSAKAYALINNPSGIWRPGIFVNAEVFQKSSIVPLAVKTDSLQTFRDWDVIFLTNGKDFQAEPVELGRKTGEWTEIISELPKGIKYVSKNSYILKADVEKSGASHDH